MRAAPGIFFLLATAAAAHAEQQKLAVLEFEVQKGLVIDRRTFSGRVQNAARKAAPNLFVMTQANIETLVRAAGKTLSECEGQCAIDTGRLVGADIVIAGRISRVGRLALSMQMYETKTGELLAGEDVEANTDAELLNVSMEATARLLAPLARKPPLSGAPRTNPPASANETRHGNPKRSTGGAGPSANPQLSAKSGSWDEVINLKGTIQVKRIDDRFSVSLDGGILVDTKTTRWWQKNIARDASWYEATSYCKSLTIEGVRGWRLPSKGELETISFVNDVYSKLQTPESPLGFWSSTEEEWDKGLAYPVPSELMGVAKGSYFHVRCVK